jgi:predicted sulfurtransferase
MKESPCSYFSRLRLTSGRLGKAGDEMVKKAVVCVAIVFMMLGWVVMADALNVSRISKEKLKSMLGNPDLVVIDVRTFFDLKMSVNQIKGAVREDPDPTKVKSWAKKYSKEKTIVLYCA